MKVIDLFNIRLEESNISMPLKHKWEALIHELAAYHSAVVAYSGGVDSSFLAYTAAQVLGERMVAVMLDSTIEAPDALKAASEFAAQHGFKHVAIPFNPLQNADFRSNPVERCYYCKTYILHALWNYARQLNYQVVLDGQNDDDRHDYRPGNRAIEETGTLSPLARHGLTKAEIRQLAMALGLSIWNKPSSPCLVTRIPYGMPVTEKALSQIAQAEQYLHLKGFKIVRVRYHNELARVEIDLNQMQMLLDLREEIVGYFKQIGFIYITLDMQGYRLGSLNEGLSL
jgi:pyridinium-3,5-biscarboxylic acid mononucleotide sulfurtransferase